MGDLAQRRLNSTRSPTEWNCKPWTQQGLASVQNRELWFLRPNLYKSQEKGTREGGDDLRIWKVCQRLTRRKRQNPEL